MATYHLTCLSPVHVGTGTQFSKFEGVYQNGQWFLIDLDKVLARGVDADDLARSMSNRDFSWAGWLQQKRIAPQEVADYHLPCAQNPQETPIREAIKDVHGQPYLPGSSVKGAIRTAVLWNLMEQNEEAMAFAEQYLVLCARAKQIFEPINRQNAFDDPKVHRAVLAQELGDANIASAYQERLYELLCVRRDRLGDRREQEHFKKQLGELGKSREWLGQRIEDFVLGKDPNHDLMRAVQVSDSQSVELETLAVGLVWTYTLRERQLVEKREGGSDFKSFVEWFKPDTRLPLTLRFDRFLFSDAANEHLKFSEAQKQVIRGLTRTCNALAKSQIQSEKAFYQNHGLTSIEQFYTRLETVMNQLPKGAFLLNIGWGSGWHFKTLGDLLHEIINVDEDWDQIRERYQLGKKPGTNSIDFNAPFPKTRRVAYEGNAPKHPMGWVKLEPKEE